MVGRASDTEMNSKLDMPSKITTLLLQLDRESPSPIRSSTSLQQSVFSGDELVPSVEEFVASGPEASLATVADPGSSLDKSSVASGARSAVALLVNKPLGSAMSKS